MLAFLALFACTRANLEVVDREPGVRAPLTQHCSDLDGSDCLLPWPSSNFLAADATSPTGVRVKVDADSLPIPDRVDYLNLGDGFSRVTGVATAFPERIDAGAANWDPAGSLVETSPVQVFNAQPGDARYGQRMAYRTEIRNVDTIDRVQDLVIGRPVEVLSPNADHVVIVLDSIGSSDRPRAVELALGLAEPETEAEAALVGYYAPTRQLLEEQNVDVNHVVRVWDFTTRSAGDATFRMHAMMDELDDNLDNLAVAIDTVTTVADPNIGVIVRGRLTGAPGFLDENGYLVLDDTGRPQVTGTAEIPFRIMIPAGEGDYKLALYGHGTGGDITDESFDSELGSVGIAKLAIRFKGWTGTDFVTTLLGFSTFLEGSERSTAGLMQALAGGTALLTAVDGVLGEALSAETIDGEPNPAAGRHPKTDKVAWLGGSMGGTMGGVMVSADPRLRIAVLNVPGSGWTHMVPYSLLYDSGMGGVLEDTYGDMLDVQVAMVMGQNSWDEVDGAPWADEALAAGGVFLLQESIDDPILPNLGTELLANSFHATQIDPSLHDITNLPHTSGAVTDGAGLSQYHVPDTGQYDVHGFAARNTPAGDAAREQILHFLTTAWAGEPEMVHPTLCTTVTPTGNCDFTGMWE